MGSSDALTPALCIECGMNPMVDDEEVTFHIGNGPWYVEYRTGGYQEQVCSFGPHGFGSHEPNVAGLMSAFDAAEIERPEVLS